MLMLEDENIDSAIFEDLRLTVIKRGGGWRATVEDVDDPNTRMSDGTEYASPDKAKRAAVNIARELFGTNVHEDELEWRGRQR